MRKKSILRGYTLVELLIYMGLLGVFVTIMSQVFVAALNTKLSSESTSAVEQDSKFILARMQYDLLKADSVSIPAAAGDTTQTLQFVDDGVTYSYALVNDRIVVTDDVDQQQLNGYFTNVSNLTFTRRGAAGAPPTISVSFDLTSTIQSQTGFESKSYQTTFGLR